MTPPQTQTFVRRMLRIARTEIAALSALMQDQEASAALRARLGQVITALGGPVPEAMGG